MEQVCPLDGTEWLIVSSSLTFTSSDPWLPVQDESGNTHEYIFIFSGDIPPSSLPRFPLGSSCPVDGQQLGSGWGGEGEAGPEVRLPKWHPRMWHRCSPICSLRLHKPRWNPFLLFFFFLSHLSTVPFHCITDLIMCFVPAHLFLWGGLRLSFRFEVRIVF